MNLIKKYIWLLPALYVSYEFGGKLFEVLNDKTEIVNIISVIKPFSSIAVQLAYFVGVFDLLIAISLITFSFFAVTKKYHKFIFIWAMLWPFLPASVRYFSGVGDFEIIQVLSIFISASVSYLLYRKFN
jgi:hypothetical protein